MSSYTSKLIGMFAGGLLAVLAFPAAIHGAAVRYNVQLNGLGSVYSGAAQAGSSGDVWNKPALNNYEGNGTSHTALTTIVSGAALVDNTGAASAVTFSMTGQNYKASYATTSTGSPIAGLNNQALKCDYISATPVPTMTVSFSGLPANAAVGLYVYGASYNANTTGSTWTMAAANGGAAGKCGYGGAYSSTNATGLNVTLASSRNLGWDLAEGHADGSGNLTVVATPVDTTYASRIWWQTYINGVQLQVYSAPVISDLTNQTVIAGQNAVFSPTIDAVPTAAYQWRENGADMTGETNATLTLASVQYSQNGYVYSLVASNPAGAATNSMTLSVIVTPDITGLNPQAVGIGSDVTISPTVDGVPTPAVQWQRGGTNLVDGATGSGSTIAGSTTTTLSITNAQVADSGAYSLIASNSAGMVTNSMSLTVSSGSVAPTITGPSDQTVVQGSNATFSASVSGLPVPMLQWLENGSPLLDKTNSSLTLSNILHAQDGYVYSLVASNSAGIKTNSATLTVQVPANISAQPTNLTVVVGSPATFSVTAGGVPAVSYQWNTNGSPIANATNAAYTIASAQGADNGAVFSVTVSNSVGVVTSSNATLTVLSAMTGAFLPTNGAANISPDQQLRLVFPNPVKLGAAGVITIRDAADDSVVATIDRSQFLSYVPGNTSIQVIPNAAIRSVQGASYYYMPIAIYGNEAWVTFTNRLAYNKTYYVNLDAGLLLDTNNAAIAGVSDSTTWRFSTKTSGPATPTVSTGPTTITVGQDGTGDFATFQGAFDWIPQNNTLARTVRVKPGIYRDNATLAQNRNFVTIVGEGASRTNAQLIYPFAYFAPPNTVFTAGSLRIESSDVTVLNLTLDNIIYNEYHPTGESSSGAPGAFAGAINTLATTGQRIVFDNDLIKGGQDTIYNVSGIIYYNNCEVWGSVDYIYGAALSVFDQCNIVQIRSSGGPCTAPSTLLAAPYGIVFLNSTFPRALVAAGYPFDVNTGTTTFMRPWRQDGATAVINCSVGTQFSTKGWLEWPPGDTETTCRAREYGTTLIGGGSVTPAQRQAAGAYWLNTIDPDYIINPSLSSTNVLLDGTAGRANRVAVAVDPSDYTLPAIFGNAYYGLDGWLPTVMPVITSQPASQTVTAGDAAAFAVSATGLPEPIFQWLKNGTNIVGATNAAYAIASAKLMDNGAYSVIVSNSAGTVTSTVAPLTVNASLRALPAIPDGTNNVTGFGAVGDGVTTNTTAIQAAIDALATSPAHGGTVEIPAGVFLSGPIHFSNNINLQIDAGSTLRMLPLGQYPGGTTSPENFISAKYLQDLEISGSGIIDGQGSPWWPYAYTNGAVRPNLVNFSACTRVWVRDVTFSNSPSANLVVKGNGGNVTIDGVAFRAPSSGDPVNPSHNTDAIDLAETNCLIQNCNISVGDDNVAMGSSGGLTADVLITNCVCGDGHGISIGSWTASGVSNVTVINCTFKNTDQGIRIKSDRDRGGVVQNITCMNLGMTNVQYPILIYCSYTNSNPVYRSLNSLTPAIAASYPAAPITSRTPIYRDIMISNVTATAQSGRMAGLIWGLPEMNITNVTLDKVTITGSKTFGIYDAQGVRMLNSRIITPDGVTNVSFYNVNLTVSNSVPPVNVMTLDGVTTNGVGNTLAFFNADASLQNTNALGDGSLTLGGSTFTVNNDLTLSSVLGLHLALGTNNTGLAVSGNLALGGTLDVSDGGGLTNGDYTVMTYGGVLSGSGPTLGNVPAGFKFSVDTNTVGLVKLVVAPPVNTTPTNLMFSVVGTALEASWPEDHTGWSLQIQTNDLSHGLGTNWVTVPDSAATNRVFIPIGTTNGCTFLRLSYP